MRQHDPKDDDGIALDGATERVWTVMAYVMEEEEGEEAGIRQTRGRGGLAGLGDYGGGVILWSGVWKCSTERSRERVGIVGDGYRSGVTGLVLLSGPPGAYEGIGEAEGT